MEGFKVRLRRNRRFWRAWLDVPNKPSEEVADGLQEGEHVEWTVNDALPVAYDAFKEVCDAEMDRLVLYGVGSTEQLDALLKRGRIRAVCN